MEQTQQSTKSLLDQATAGCIETEALLIARYRDKLVALAASRLPPDTRKRIDPDDVVQSACRIFIDRVRNGQVSVELHGELWHYLVAITLNKIRSLVRKHRSHKRSVFSEATCPADSILSREPTADEAYMLVETIEELLDALPNERQRRVIALRLQGETTAEIAKATSLSVERVRQIIRWARSILERDRQASE